MDSKGPDQSSITPPISPEPLSGPVGPMARNGFRWNPFAKKPEAPQQAPASAPAIEPAPKNLSTIPTLQLQQFL